MDHDVKRLTDKSIRHQNEVQGKKEQFCKRHGIENVDECIKSSNS